jgi:tripartite-type tricarboxylate transporter receptor subunit TctC
MNPPSPRSSVCRTTDEVSVGLNMANRCSSRRSFIRKAALAAGASFLSSCGKAPASSRIAQTCIDLAGKRIRWIVPHEAGGGLDTLSRIIAAHLGTALHSEVIVESHGGAGGLIGAQEIRDSAPDGLTFGILDASGFMAPFLAGERTFPNPVSGFTVLSRVSRSHHIWATSRDSPLKSVEDVLQLSRTRPVVFPINDVGSVGFLTVTLTSHLLDMPVKIVAGYGGSRSGILAALRGEIDVITYNLDTLMGQIKSGDLRPLLQVADEPLSSHDTLKGVPLFGGAEGLVAAHARAMGRDVNEAQADATAVATMIGAGKLIVAPPGMDRALSACLSQTIVQVLTSQTVRSVAEAANISLDVADWKTAAAEYTDLGQRIDKFLPSIRSAIERIRQ